MKNAKLVRDKIPDVIRKNGEAPAVTCIGQEDMHGWLVDKLQEECGEYADSEELEELADILEVIHSIADSRGVAYEYIYALMLRKRASRGGFELGYILKTK